MSFSSGRLPISCARLGRYRDSPEASRTRKALACTQCRARSVREKRDRRGASAAVAIRVADPGVLVVAVLLPVALRLAGDEFHPGQPLDTFVAVHLREDDACRRTMRPRERPAGQLVGEHRIGKAELLECERI